MTTDEIQATDLQATVEELANQNLTKEQTQKLAQLQALLSKATVYTNFVSTQLQNGGSLSEDPEWQMPSLITSGKLRSYQVTGVKWLISLFENGLNGILADEMGLGKTFQCITFIAYLYEKGIHGPFLVVGPLSTITNWQNEFKRFAPDLPVLLYHGSKQERADLRAEHLPASKPAKWPIIITSYELIMQDVQYLRRPQYKYLVIDEAHRLKNMNCKLLRTLKQFDVANRVLLTGTPLQNSLKELWSLLNFLLPNVFDDLEAFESWFDFDFDNATADSGDNVTDETTDLGLTAQAAKSIIDSLHTLLQPFILRRLKSDVELGVPHKREYIVYAELTAGQKAMYNELLDVSLKKKANKDKPVEIVEGKRSKRAKVSYNELYTDDELHLQVQSEYDDESTESEDENSPLNVDREDVRLVKDSVASPVKQIQFVKKLVSSLQNLLMQLRKVCNHPYLFGFPRDSQDQIVVDQDIAINSGKMALLHKLLQVLFERGHKVLVFSQMTAMLDIIAEYFEWKGIEYCILDGSMAHKDRQAQIDRFNTDEKVDVFLLSTRAGGLGINLVAADTVIIYDSDWNPTADAQAMDRCHRIGQTRPVIVYRLSTINTVETRILDRAGRKRLLGEMVMHKRKFKAGHEKAVDVEDLVEILEQERKFRSLTAGSYSANIGDGIGDEEIERILDRSEESFKRDVDEGVWFKLVSSANISEAAEVNQDANTSEAAEVEQEEVVVPAKEPQRLTTRKSTRQPK